MHEAAILRYLTNHFDGVDIVEAAGTFFIFYSPAGDQPKDHRFPFVTLVTNDDHDQFSDLNRPGVFRLNIGVSRATFRTLFPTRPVAGADAPEDEPEPCGDDFTALDRLLPHPVYGKMFWVCVLNPGDGTFERVRPLLAEAYELAKSRHAQNGANR